MFTFYEFFAGGGMARLGLGPAWTCLFANDFSAKKAAVYLENFPERPTPLKLCDVAALTTADLPERPDLAWGSFPCQDLSLAGNGAGLDGQRSGVFWPFVDLLERLDGERRAPRVVVVENVEGAVTSSGGADFAAIVEAFVSRGYRIGAIIADAVHFVPQSRARVFFVAVKAACRIPDDLHCQSEDSADFSPSIWHSEGLRMAYKLLSPELRKSWIWWRLPAPPPRTIQLEDVLERDQDVRWHTAETTRRLLSLMSEVHLEKVRKAAGLGRRVAGAVYKRTRDKVQRAEVRFDGVSGCLRTPRGGSSRQTILSVEGPSIRSRLLTAREAARLMGLPETYRLPTSYNDAYHVAGDGLAVPVVSWIERWLLRPLLEANRAPVFFQADITPAQSERMAHV